MNEEALKTWNALKTPISGGCETCLYQIKPMAKNKNCSHPGPRFCVPVALGFPLMDGTEWKYNGK